MQSTLATGVGLAADTYFLAGSSSLIVVLIDLASELYGSKEICLELIDSVSKIEPRLKELATSDSIKVKTALKQYFELLVDIRGFLEGHVNHNFLSRAASHWKMKRRVQVFYAQLETIKTLVALDDMAERASRHTLVMKTLQRSRHLDDQTNQAIAASVTALQSVVEAVPDEIAARLKSEGVALVDIIELKKELKTNEAAYSSEDYQALLALLKRVSKALDVQIPHIAGWYLSRSDICFDDSNPFAVNDLRELYHGTIYSGAKVTIKAVKASSDDTKTLELFNKEVKTWFELRDPHILPLYGANNVGYPLLFVSGRAELGNFRDYLLTRRHRVWELFLDAARGIAYLHKHKRVHGNLKCNNLLVTAQGVGVVSDFAFAFVRETTVLSVKPLAPAYHWKAPECIDTNPRFESDVYALGMCLYEALSGITPYSGMDEQSAIRMIKSGELPPRPNGDSVSDEAWELISNMCDRQFSRRIHLSEAIAVFEALAAREKIKNQSSHCTCECRM
ncbi:Serine/threonine-protein kinase STY46 [Phytophthora citrophthora]|uniref:Serine/threonine-protein kinase STY46 n=1 Tax=Phytophthora citrophthora TaxID=4793 RepID=A0AAD9GN79_9STRA|nr:Serine/threonine-protein kinase STY46 [Phytophthora citrophthora]